MVDFLSLKRTSASRTSPSACSTTPIGLVMVTVSGKRELYGSRGDRLGRVCLNSPLYLGNNTYKCQGQTVSHLWHPGRRMLGTGTGTGTDTKKRPFDRDSAVISRSRVTRVCLHKLYGTLGDINA